MTTPTATPFNERRFLLTLAGVQFTHILDFMIMMPLGPQLIRALQIDTHQFGLLLSSYTFTAAASSLLAATYIDRFDRRKLLLTLYTAFILATLACGLAPNFTLLLIARALAGAFGGILGAMVQTMVADVIPFERRGKAMGRVMAAFSISTVAGVPLGLLFVSSFPSLGWRAPFFFIVALSLVIWVVGFRQLPSLVAHLSRPREGNVAQQLFKVMRAPTHLRAFAFISLLMLAGFTVIPYFALYTTTNVALPDHLLTLVYLCGGAATFFTSQWIGRLSDRHGKFQTYRTVALLSLIPLLITTHMGPSPLWFILLNSTIFFILMPGRMVPGMAMVTGVPEQHVRGTFMTLISAVQMMSSGVATLIGGLIITQTTEGRIEHYDVVGYVAVVCSLLTIWLAAKLHTPAPLNKS